MKKILKNVGAKMAALADDIASYNDSARSAAVQGGSPLSWPLAAGALDGSGAGGTSAAAGSGNSGGSSDGPDVVAIAFQELVPLNAGSVIGVWGTDHADAWDRCVGAYLNGEDWAAQQYGPAAPPAVGQAAAAAAAASLLDTKWQGGPQPTAPPGPSGQYVQVASKQLVGVYLTVWVRRSLLPVVRGVQVTTVATGFGGYLGNKGAVAARLRLFDSSLVLLAAHLTAGEAEGDEVRRNADVADILRRAAFASGPDGGGAVAMTSAAAASVSPSNITDHDLVIWMGDLNYRLATTNAASAAAGGAAGSGGGAGAVSPPPGALSDAEVRAAIRSGALEPLLAADQLLRERAAGRVFQGWREGRITFLPTYKFKVGTSVYNGDDAALAPGAGSASTGALQSAADPAGVAEDDASTTGSAPDPERHKKRTPAWCDRVLWWERRADSAGPGSGMEQLGYWRGELTVSDHKPVAAAFRASLRAYHRGRIEALLEAALRAVDRMQESMRPKVTVEPVVLDAGEWVATGRPVPLRLTLANTGTVEAIFHFVPPPQPQAPGKRAGQTYEIELTVMVDGGPGGGAEALSATSSSSGAVPLDVIAILRIEDSGDKFISIGGRYLRSFLGLPLETLVGMGQQPALAPAEASALAGKLGLPPLLLMGAPTADACADGADGVPKELRGLLAALRADGAAALRQPGILGESSATVLRRVDGGGAGVEAVGLTGVAAGNDEGLFVEARQPTSREAQRALIRELEWLRLHLDAGYSLPPSADPHDVAALLLLWLGQLPQPLISRAAAEAAAATPPASAGEAAALLRRHCTPAALAALAALLSVLRDALAPEAAAGSGLTAATLAGVLSAWCLPPLPTGAAADAAANRLALMVALLGDGPEAAAAVEGLAEGMPDVAL
ncbi:hypothetical protein GPECTOR_6g633 [Gonium pectorale]|uniref:Inositol polyphosphate-related phosphatase domain-containing protein n=1 Tax=Gonium pectorale TaxID=33097 RepID=A0A150GV16_GONPE|nr:hypothetical protein GPECTOR_6g633 [Gonium pectorale]|eukprot:KXZ53716.1 hypothetical protein GPECTOR_6g633 [Gonium pectorale]